MSVWRFAIQGRIVKHGENNRMQLTVDGCNEPFKNRYWCPKLQWFKTSPCPFINRNECETYEQMCGGL